MTCMAPTGNGDEPSDAVRLHCSVHRCLQILSHAGRTAKPGSLVRVTTQNLVEPGSLHQLKHIGNRLSPIHYVYIKSILSICCIYIIYIYIYVCL